MIETLVALGLLVAMLVMWQPVVASLGQLTWRDAEALKVATFERITQNQVATEGTVSIDAGRLVITQSTKTKTLKYYSGNSGAALIFTRADDAGFEPVLTEVDQVAWTKLDHAVKYTVTMKSGRIYEGVIVDGAKTR